MNDFIQGIKNFVWAAIGLGCLFVVIIQWNALAPAMDTFATANWTSAVYANDSGTGQFIASSWKYILFFVIPGGVIALIIFTLKRKGER
ncbi:MAG: hypothetical protein WC499_04065 [Patescibacteria group bacterium]